jgi:hypothetical protein
MCLNCSTLEIKPDFRKQNHNTLYDPTIVTRQIGNVWHIPSQSGAQTARGEEPQVIYCRNKLLQQIQCCNIGFIVIDNCRCQPSLIRYETDGDINKLSN